MLHETLGISPDAIEAQLGHQVSDRLGSAYNRTKYLDKQGSHGLGRLRDGPLQENQR